jgi:biopolymer transport protein ExbD
MGKVKIKKADVWIDMTPMSDVMVLLLTFFMMSSTFVTPEPVKVNAPNSASKVKVPEIDVLNILVNPDGRIYMSMSDANDLRATVASMNEKFSAGLTDRQIAQFTDNEMFGISMDSLKIYMDAKPDQRSQWLPKRGIKTDSIQGADGQKGMSEFQHWVKEAKAAARANDHTLKLCIKADSKTPYKTVKQIMSELQDMDENRYQLITSYKKKD